MKISSLGLKGRIGLLLAASFAGLLCLIAYFSAYLTNKTVEFEYDRLRAVVRSVADQQHDKVEDVYQSLQWLSQQVDQLRPSTPGCNALLAGEQRRTRHFSNIAFVLANGDVVCSARPTARQLNIADRKSFRKALDTPKVVAGQPVTSLVSGAKVIPFYLRVSGHSGELHGVLAIALGVEELENGLGALKLPDGARIGLVSDKGDIVVRVPDPEALTGKNFADSDFFRNISAAGREGVGEIRGFDGLLRINAFTHFMDVDEGHLTLFLNVPESVVMAEANHNLLVGLLMVIAIMLLTSLVVAIISNRLLFTPLQSLFDTAHRLGQGDLAARSGLVGVEGEIGEFARVIDQMAAGLQRSALQKESDFQLLIDNMLESCRIIDFDWKYVYVNQAFAREMGCGIESLIGINPLEKYPAMQEAPLTQRLRRVMESRVAASFEEQRILGGKPGGWAQFYVHPVPQGIFIFSMDLTERKQAETALRERMKELHCLYEVFRVTEGAEGSLDGIFKAVVDLLPPAWLHADDAAARIRYKGRECATPGFVPTGWMQTAGFGDAAGGGDITVAYLHPHAEEHEGPFLAEERALLETIAKRLTGAIERRRIDVSLRRSRRALSAINACGQIIAQAASEREVLDGICKTIVEQGGYRMAWVGIAQDDAERNVIPAAVAGAGDEYLAKIRVSWADNEWGKGPTGRAIRLQRVEFARHIDTDPAFAVWREAALKQGYASSVALPLIVEGAGCLGALNIYATEPDAFDAEELALLTAFASDLALGIRTQRARVETQRAQEAERETASRLQHLLSSSSAIVYVLRLTDSGQIPLDVSDNISRILGYSREEALQPGWWIDNLHAEDRDRAISGSQRALGDERVAHDYRFRHKDGHYLWVHDELYLRRDAAGRPAEIVGAWHDIQELRESSEKVRQLSLVVEQTADAVLITDLEGRIVYVNHAFEQRSGYSRGEVAGFNPRLLKSGLTPDSTYEEMWATLKRGDAWHGELINRRKDGSIYIENVQIVPLRDEAGNIIRYVGIKADITERKAAEAQLRKLSLAVEQSPESIVISNLDAEIEYVNAAFLQATGYSREEVIGQNPRVLHSGKTPESTYKEMWAALTQGMAWKGEFINKRKDGSEYIEFAIIAPIRDAQNKVTHYLAIKDDITEKKRIGHELDRHRHHLEELVDLRTRELDVARVHAEVANRAKSEFLANMSHEIRTPMNAILGMTHILRHADPKPDQVDRLGKIDAAAQHLLSIINDILDLSKIEAGKLVVESIDFELPAVVVEACEIFHDRAQDKGLVLAHEIDPAIPRFLRGDPLRLRQLLINLIGNAVKFTDHGRVGVRVRLLDSSDGALRLHFEVSDTGIGLTEAQRARLFQPFEQADASTTRRFGGTGLGLALCQRLVTLCRGSIGVDSEEGRGSRFWFELPLQPGVSPPGAGTVERPAAPAPDARSSAALRILVVEDDEINREVVLELLAGAGFHADSAVNGVRALEQTAARQYDLILMDMQMPEMDGLEATRQLRRRAAYEHVPIIALTANVFTEDREKCLAAGMNDFVAKPIVPEQLIGALQRWSAAAVILPPPAAEAAGDRYRALLAVPGLDTAAGLRPVQGNWKTYERMLRHYADERAGAVLELRRCIEDGRTEDARRMAHTLKGLAGTLGAEALRQAAAAVEESFKRGQSVAETEALVPALERVHDELVRALRAALPAPLPAADEAVGDWEQARRLVSELDALLEADDMRATTVLREHAAMFRTVFAQRADAIEADIRAFRFQQALAAVRTAVQENLALSQQARG